MKGYIPNGMIQKELNWEWTNLQLYELLADESPFAELTGILNELIKSQKNQYTVLQEFGISTIKAYDSNISNFEYYDDYSASVKELYEREYQLLQEYLSLYEYFLVNHSLKHKLLPIIEAQQIQVKFLLQVNNLLDNLSSKDSSSISSSYKLENGYILESVEENLNYPTSICFDEKGQIYIAESGFVYGQPPSNGRILRLDENNQMIEISNGFPGPLTGMTYYNGYFFVSVGNRDGIGGNCGKIIKVSLNGEKQELVKGLPTCGDHFTGDIVVGPDHKLYFGVGTATNSGVVGVDNTSWLKLHRFFHDTPARDYKLTGEKFITNNPFSNTDIFSVTGAFKPFGELAQKNEVIKGNLYANGILYRCDQDGSNLEIIADGFRNPFGIQFSPFNHKLYITDNGADPRGSRQVSHDWDNLWQVEVKNGWHGWPDFFSGLPVTLQHFNIENKPKPSFLIEQHPKLASQPITRFETHSSSNKFDFSTSEKFGHVGEIFIAQIGDFGFEDPNKFHGYKVVRVNNLTGQIRPFLINPLGEKNNHGPIRPIEAKFSKDGTELFVLDIGYIGKHGNDAKPNSGVLWRVKKK